MRHSIFCRLRVYGSVIGFGISIGIAPSPSEPIHLLISLHIMIVLTRIFFHIVRWNTGAAVLLLLLRPMPQHEINGEAMKWDTHTHIEWVRVRNLGNKCAQQNVSKPIWHLSHTLFSLKIADTHTHTPSRLHQHRTPGECGRAAQRWAPTAMDIRLPSIRVFEWVQCVQYS